jgi:hypothetical protein
VDQPKALLLAQTQQGDYSMTDNTSQRPTPQPDATRSGGRLYSMRDPERRSIPQPNPPAAPRREERR